MLKILKQKNKGFTIMETLIAISLLLLAITGPMAFAQHGLRAAFSARDQITGFYLAQDAIELVKNVRDHNILSRESTSWLGDFANCRSTSGEAGCSVDTSTAGGTILGCNESDAKCLGENEDGSDDQHLMIAAETGIIGHTGDEQSIFSRTVFIDPVSPDVSGYSDEVKITVKVRWKSHENLGVRNIEVVEYVYNWASALGL